MDTKGTEAVYLSERIQHPGMETFLLDLSMRQADGALQGDISADEVAEAGGGSLKGLSESKDMAVNMGIMVSGAVSILQRMVKEGAIHGVIGIGGYSGTFVATTVMQSLPFGLPKVMVSSAAALPGLCNQFIKRSDILLFHSVIEISGLSDLCKNVLDRAAHAIQGMVGGSVSDPVTDPARAIAMTMMNTCEKCARAVRLALEGEGFQVVGFHAAGIGDRVMDEMIAEGHFRGVVDLAPGGVGEHLYGCMRDAGSDRLESAGRTGIPQILSTCGVNHMTPSRSRYTPEHHERRRFDLDTYRTWLRMTPRELRDLAAVFAEKLNASLGPVKIMVPLRGWSSVDAPGSPTFDPEEDLIFVGELHRRIKNEIQMIQVDANMEDPEFAEAVIKVALKVFDRGERGTSRT